MTSIRLLLLGGVLASIPAHVVAVDDVGKPSDLVVADFEGADYAGWTVEGTAFGSGPAKGTLPGQMAVTGYLGKGLVNSFLGGDDSLGRLTSPEFTIERPFLAFLIGGGRFPGQTCIELLIDGTVVRSETGPNSEAGGSEELQWESWDVAEFRGRRARIRITDDRKGGWGHVNVDQIVQTDTRRATTVAVHREIVLEGRYLLLPVENRAKNVRMRLKIDGVLRHDFDIALAPADPDWWAFLEFPGDVGKRLEIQVDKVSEASRGVGAIVSSSELRHTAPLYDEALRPQLRFSQMRGWNNDPNGMVYFDGEYHLFWQSNPFGPNWANMYWGHAVSRDLVHWTELPYALYPRVQAKEHCFSGSANLDEGDTGGFGRGEGGATMIAAFTDTGAGEAIAYSKDRGRTWVYPTSNPIIPKHGGRDPKLIRHEPTGRWVIAVYSRSADQDVVAFYTSKDLKSWERTGEIPGFFECPELFELPVDGDPADKRWVLFAADAKYVVGRFDGRTFLPEHEGKHQLHHGDYYASQCFSRVPGGRVIQVGWARIAMPGMPFNQAFSLPTELALRTTPAGLRLHAEPIRELESLRGRPRTIRDRVVGIGSPARIDVPERTQDVELQFEPGSAKAVTIEFGTNRLRYDAIERKLDGIPLEPSGSGRIRIRIVVDRPMFEVVGGPGSIYRTHARGDAGKAIEAVTIRAEGGEARLIALDSFPMRSIWESKVSDAR
ncbi:MAG: glycoside hydrolase family 32 protein [Isosphaeraceae bacterium]|nr:glycoside hydrolase family 32 protein [Isosphaeraceae bacterium]